MTLLRIAGMIRRHSLRAAVLATMLGYAAVAAAQPTPERLNAFLCYESTQEPFRRPGVALTDRFDTNGPSTVTVERAHRLCAPAAVAPPSRRRSSVASRATSGDPIGAARVKARRTRST